jgi:hypothetical protein
VNGSGTQRKVGIGAAGVLVAWLGHAGALGDDVARHSRNVLRAFGLASQHVDDQQLIKKLMMGNGLDQAVARAACAAIGTKDGQPDNFYSRPQWKVAIRRQLPTWVPSDPSDATEGLIDDLATALALAERNPKAMQAFVTYCI